VNGETSDLFQGEPDLVPGELRGFRRWKGVDENGGLKSTGVDYTWESGQVQTARCFAGVYSMYPPHDSSETPKNGCQCGFYGWYNPADSRIPLAGVEGAVFGVVKATGRVILGSHGFRAEHVEIVAVCTTNRVYKERLLKHTNYQVFDTEQELLEAYPPEDVSELVDHKCDGKCLDKVQFAQQQWNPWGMYTLPNGMCNCPACQAMKAQAVSYNPPSYNPPSYYQASYTYQPPTTSSPSWGAMLAAFLKDLDDDGSNASPPPQIVPSKGAVYFLPTPASIYQQATDPDPWDENAPVAPPLTPQQKALETKKNRNTGPSTKRTFRDRLRGL
jgi:hypothetical protein